jgi:hypothetical protein
VWLRGALVVVAIAALLGVFGLQSGLQRPQLKPVNLAGIAVMIVGLAVSLFGGRLVRDKQAAPFARLGGVLVCGIGAAMVFI